MPIQVTAQRKRIGGFFTRYLDIGDPGTVTMQHTVASDCFCATLVHFVYDKRHHKALSIRARTNLSCLLLLWWHMGPIAKEMLEDFVTEQEPMMIM